MTLPRPRREGWAPLEAYAVLGDGRGVALVADDGSIDWWPVPTIDAPPICASILDPAAGGSYCVRPAEAAGADAGRVRCERRYLPSTNVLETTWTTPGGVARVTDALVTGAAGRLPWTELSRRIEGVEGTVELRWWFEPGDRFATTSPWILDRGGIPTVVIGDQTVALLVTTDDDVAARGVSDPELAHRQVSGSVTVSAGQRVTVSATAADASPLYVSGPADVDRRFDRTVGSWQTWASLLALPSRWSPAVERSALALKTLLYEPGGAIAAAATTSLPEAIGGEKNWDYRYSWVRDSSFTVEAFLNLGLHEEVQAGVSWLLGALRASAPELEIFYALDGSPPPGAKGGDGQGGRPGGAGGLGGGPGGELDVPGYRHSRPVRAGNMASGQIQLGVYGDLFATIWRFTEAGHLLDGATSSLLDDLAEKCCDTWRLRDAGIWELPGPRHHTFSKMGCWVALDRAVRLAECGQMPDTHADRWRHEADAIHDWVDAHCWSDRLGSYTMAAGGEDLDAACVLAGRVGFDRGERLAGTIDAVAGALQEGALVWRYSGMRREEGAFIACTFWMAEALAYVGRLDDAVALMDRAVAELPNDVGILSEQKDRSGASLGNLPQGLSHLALVNTAFVLDAALDGTGTAP